jgi:hypothetical protein
MPRMDDTDALVGPPGARMLLHRVYAPKREHTSHPSILNSVPIRLQRLSAQDSFRVVTKNDSKNQHRVFSNFPVGILRKFKPEPGSVLFR